MRVAVISYLNALPLTQGLPWPVDPLLPAQMTPSQLAQYDLILGPVVLGLDTAAWQIIWDAPAIGCRGAVGSVRLDFTNGHDIQTARTFGLSPESQSSNQLLQIMLRRHWRHANAVCVDPAASLAPPDAQLVIGDRALLTPVTNASIDLGAAWHEWTGHPFIFACWLQRPGAVIADDVIATLRTTRDHNLQQLPAILRSMGLTTAAMLHYFTQQLIYDFDAPQHAGLRRFFCGVE